MSTCLDVNRKRIFSLSLSVPIFDNDEIYVEKIDGFAYEKKYIEINVFIYQTAPIPNNISN